MPLWLLALAGVVRIDAYVGAMFWHAHEMVFGFTAAVIAGFLLTAVGNWTGRETAVGGRLLALVALWLVGRVAFAAMAVLPGPVIAVADLAFLPVLAVVVGRALVVAAVVRVIGPFSMAIYPATLYLAGILWSLAFATFTVAFARILVEPRIDGLPG